VALYILTALALYITHGRRIGSRFFSFHLLLPDSPWREKKRRRVMLGFADFGSSKKQKKKTLNGPKKLGTETF
jgi:hypothetical protein